MIVRVKVLGVQLNKHWEWKGKEGTNNYLHVAYEEPMSGTDNLGSRVEKLKFGTDVREVYSVLPGDVCGVDFDRYGKAVYCEVLEHGGE